MRTNCPIDGKTCSSADCWDLGHRSNCIARNRAAAIRDEAKLYVDDQGRYCATINQNDYEWLLSLAESKA